MVTFETKVWEKDWEYILMGDYLARMIKNCNYNFSRRQIIINNVKDRNTVEKQCIRKIKEGVIDCYYVIDDYQPEILDHYGLTVAGFKGGYHYSSAELLGIYKCETDYLLHFSGDAFPLNNGNNWIDEALCIMSGDSRVVVANPAWNKNFREARNESFDEIHDFYLGYGFSDQAYLIRKSDFSTKIYNEKNVDSERYPKHGGESFEKRVDSFMRNRGKLRITHKYASYIHKNFPKNLISRRLMKDFVYRKRIKLLDNS